MTPIYFPFTYVSKQVAEVLSVCFDKTIVYQPSSQNIPESMGKLVDRGVLDIRIPANSDEEKLAGIIREYKNWAQVHQGDKMSFFKTQTGNTPFYDEISAHRIRTDIKKKEKNETSEQKADPILQARIFLSMAQEFDENQWDISSGLESFAEMEKTLIEEMIGDKDSGNINGLTPNRAITKDEPGIHMTDQRLKSWTSLLLCDPEHSNFFVTTSRYVIDTLLENFQKMEMVFRETIPENSDSDEWKKNLKENIKNISGKPDAGNTLKSVSAENKVGNLTIYKSYARPEEYFSQSINKDLSQKTDNILENKEEYVLIGLIEMD